MRKPLSLIVAMLMLLGLSCGDEDGAPTGPDSKTGSIRVILAMSGGDLDADGCAFTVDSGAEQRLSAGERATFSDLVPGAHVVVVSDVAGNCQVDGGTSRTVTVVAGGTAQETFTLVCVWRSRIAFKSMRNGDGIYVMNPDGTGRIKLTSGDDSGPAWSPDGARIAFSRLETSGWSIWVVNADGTGLVKLAGGNDFGPAWSPDGNRIAFSRTDDSGWGIWVMNADGSGQVNLSHDPRPQYHPTWSPDGTEIAFADQREGNFEVYVMGTDGTEPMNLTNDPAWDGRPAWSPDGTRIAFVRGHTSPEIWLMNADGSGQSNITNRPPANDNPTWSPDGTRIAFDSERDGNKEIYVMNTDGTGQVNLTNYLGWDATPAWSPDLY